jgi:hypothetical protein
MARTKVFDADLRSYLDAGHTQAQAARHFGVSEAANTIPRSLRSRTYRRRARKRPSLMAVVGQFQNGRRP